MASEYDVAIVGAGAAGVAAARQLSQAGRAVIVVEASDRVGGRAWTSGIAGMALDLGCGWLHSADRNPMVALAEAAGFSVDRVESAWRAQYRNLGFSRDDQHAAWSAWTEFEARLEQDPPASDRAVEALEPGNPWNAYLEALSGYINGAGLAEVSVADYLAYDHASTDRNWRVEEGYGALIAGLLPVVALRLSTPVTAIDHRGPGVRLATRAGTIEAKVAIVTASTAVLSSGAIAFDPAIDSHLDAAARLPLGLADKLFLGLGVGHGLEPDTHLIGDPRSATTGSYYIMPFGRPVIECYFGGEGAEAVEQAGLAAAFDFAAGQLAALLGNGIRGRLRPLIGSSWRRTDHVGGSYSHALPGHAPCRAILASPIDGRLFLAGEATHPTDYSTAHGAWQSGVRAAEEALAALASLRR
jgi:monoamine oxidase